jgi:hypothetical protein
VVFERLNPIQFIAALGDPTATSGTGAEKWGLWRGDPGTRGFYLRDYAEKVEFWGGTAPAGWTVDPSSFWVEERGVILPVPEPLPLQKIVQDGEKTTVEAPEMRYLVTGERDVTAVLTVYADGRWELSKGTLEDVTRLESRSGVYSAATGEVCKPLPSMQSSFPVKPGARMPKFKGCDTEDRAVLVVLAIEASQIIGNSIFNTTT